MGVTYRHPAPPLDAYIASLWHRDGPAPYPHLIVLPRPTLHLMINLGDAYHAYQLGEFGSGADDDGADGGSPGATCNASWVAGVWDRAHVMAWPRELRILSVIFRPGGAAPFLRLPLAELRNQLVPLDAIWGSAAAEISERLGAQPTPQARLALLERLLLARLARSDHAASERTLWDDPWLATVQQAVAAIARTHGKLLIDALSAQLGLSHKHLITQFQRLVGTTPKALARLYRLRYLLRSLEPGSDLGRTSGLDRDLDPGRLRVQPLTCTQIAHQAGYFDEAHFNKDFRAFTGLTPGAYLRTVRQAHTEHPEYGPPSPLQPTGGSGEGGRRQPSCK